MLIDSDEYLLHVCRYVHLNPVVARLVDRPERWEYSDYREWISDSGKCGIQCLKIRSEHFGSGAQYQRFVMDYLAEERIRDRIERMLLGEPSKKSVSKVRSPSSHQGEPS